MREGDVVLATAAGGDRALALLAARPRRVDAVDAHPAQVHLLELKLAALKALGRAEYVELLGVKTSNRRRALYERVRWLLPRETDDFWTARSRLLEEGVVNQGLLERRLASFQHFVRLVQGRRRVERFISLGNEAERREAYAREWGTCLWRTCAPLLWSRWFGPSPGKMEEWLCSGALLAPPPEMPVEVFEEAKAAANRMIVVHGPPEHYVRSLPARSIDLFALGGVPIPGLEAELARIARPGARYATGGIEA